MDNDGRPNIVVRGWWPRWRYRPTSIGVLRVRIDGEQVATLASWNKRSWRSRLADGSHRIELVDLGRSGSPAHVLDVLVSYQPITIWYRGDRHPNAWVESGLRRPTWFAPKERIGRRGIAE